MDRLSIRYNIEHVGDIVVDLLEKPVDLAQKFARGVALTYDIRELHKKRQAALKELGEEMVRVSAVDPSALAGAESIASLTSQLEEIDKALDAKIKEREENVPVSPCCEETATQ
ncbi:MAG: hypothetical protein OEV28_06075 [Nitrospirota bacterium]|nr:hypothetical protein [Nitrospirota bacterium]